jgi:hypothetical protein
VNKCRDIEIEMSTPDPYDYAPNLLHAWFPPEQLRRWRNHRWRGFARLVAMLLSLLPMAILALYFNLLLFDAGMSWGWVVAGLLPGVAALLGVLVMGGHFVTTVSGLEAWRKGFSYALLCLFGRPWPIPYPFAIIKEGKIRAGDEDKFVADRRLGGPGKLIIFNDSAAVLEQYGRISRVEGPRIIFVERSERMREVLDLRPQKRTVEDALSYTKDGIALKTDITVRFQLQRGTSASPETAYPVEQSTLQTAAKAEAMLLRPGAAPVRFDWKARVMGNVDSTLRAIVAGKCLDELFEPTDLNKDPRAEIGQEMIKRLRQQSASFGAEVLDVTLSDFRPVHSSVEQQRLASWLAAQRSKDHVQEARGEAQTMLARETAYSYAQLEMMLAIDQGFRRLAQRDEDLPSHFIALRFVEMLRRMASNPRIGPLLPIEAVQALQSWNRLLAQSSSRAADGRGSIQADRSGSAEAAG